MEKPSEEWIAKERLKGFKRKLEIAHHDLRNAREAVRLAEENHRQAKLQLVTSFLDLAQQRRHRVSPIGSHPNDKPDTVGSAACETSLQMTGLEG